MKLFFVKSIEPFISKLPAAAEVGAGMRYTLRDAKIGNSLYTTGINTCSGFGLRAGEQNLLETLPELLKGLSKTSKINTEKFVHSYLADAKALL